VRGITMARIRNAVVVAALLAGATLLVGLIERLTGTANASVVYLAAVVAAGISLGTGWAIATAVGSFLGYTFFFTEPVHTFTIDDPEVVISVVLFLFVGVVVGRLAGAERERTRAAADREREARVLFGLSRALATRDSTTEALAGIAAVLRDETGMRRVWISLGADASAERVAADSDPGGTPVGAAARQRVLQRTPGDEPARWSLLHVPATGRHAVAEQDLYRVRIQAGGATEGSIWAARDPGLGEPGHVPTRLLAAAADQVGQALAHDRAQAASQTAEIARQSDRLKSSLLQSVSHDFRTPLAVIRAAAGSLEDDGTRSDEDRRANVAAIDREVEYLDRLVANLLDLSRIEAGSLRARTDVYDVDDLVGLSLQRIHGRLDGRRLETAIEPLPVRVDPVFLGAAVANVLDNAVKYSPAGGRIRISTAPAGDDGSRVRLTVEDDGQGVPPEALPRLFGRFYRVEGAGGTGRGGLGIGLAVARGLTEAMGGRVAARRSPLGGLAIDLDLPAARVGGAA
jgi:two-component system, OmpR family, sensor histidine kinase KdpD